MKLVDNLVGKLISDGAIEAEDREIYEYGFYQGIIMLINILCTILIGVFMKMVWEVVIFMIAYIPLRTYAGGFHAKTQMRCFVYSNLFVVIVMAASSFLTKYLLIAMILGILGAAVIVLLAPVEDKNKPIDDTECKIYGKKARQILLFDMILAGILYIFHYHKGVSTIMVSSCCLGIFLVMGFIKNNRLDKKGNEET